MPDSYPRLKVLTALGAGLVAFGFSPIFVRFTPETPPLVLAAYRTVIASLLLLPYWYMTRDRAVTPTKDKFYVFLAGLCLGIHFICWIASLHYTSVASASVLVTIHPIMLILIERLWFKRSFAITSWIGVGMAFSGSVLLGISDSQIETDFSDPLFGNFLAASAAAIFVVYLLIGQKIRQKREWVDYVFPVYFFAGATCVITALALGNNLLEISLIGAASATGMAVFPQIIGHGSMNYAVKYVSPTLISTLILTEPIFATFLAYVLFDELPPITSFIAMLIIIIGVGLTWRRKARNK
ncbi:DMT family transporter [Halalkalibaculum sp. DA3122]|uniref:DMT family transporter n=1 Tax=unclassified Halalkalibaculum TaxID=2964617 RepID=UPI003754888E